MSQYNRANHDQVDRRNEEARQLLLRLGCSEVQQDTIPPVPLLDDIDRTVAWKEYAIAHNMPLDESESLTLQRLRGQELGEVETPIEVGRVWPKLGQALIFNMSKEIVEFEQDTFFEIIDLSNKTTNTK